MIQGVRAGLSISDAAERAGLAYATVRNWLAQGRAESGTPHADFAAAIDIARDEAAGAELTLDEFNERLARSVRNGSVQAARLWWAIHGTTKAEPERPRDRLDDLKDRRAERLAQQARARGDGNGNGAQHG